MDINILKININILNMDINILNIYNIYIVIYVL